jgi:hypothetical protein
MEASTVQRVKGKKGIFGCNQGVQGVIKEEMNTVLPPISYVKSETIARG